MTSLCVFFPHQKRLLAPWKNIFPYRDAIAELCAQARQRSLEGIGHDLLHQIIVPIRQQEFEILLQNNIHLRNALTNYVSLVSYHLPKDPWLSVVIFIPLQLIYLNSCTPLKRSPTVFTDGGKTRGAIAYQCLNLSWTIKCPSNCTT